MSKLQYNCHLWYIIPSVFNGLKAFHSCLGLSSQIAFGKLVPRSCALSLPSVIPKNIVLMRQKLNYLPLVCMQLHSDYTTVWSYR